MFLPSDTAVFALINETDKKIYVSYSSRLHQRLGIIQSEILKNEWKYPDMIQDKDKLECVILDSRCEKIFVKFFIDQYRNNGYSIYNELDKIPLEYKFRMEIAGKKILVVAVNKRNDKEVLGTFQYVGEAYNFLEYIKKNNPTGNLVYAL